MVRWLFSSNLLFLKACLWCMVYNAYLTDFLTLPSGRYNLTLPAMECSVCLATWAVGLSDLLMSGYWPASVHFETVYEAGLFRSFLDLKLLAPGVLRQAFLGISVYGKKSR